MIKKLLGTAALLYVSNKFLKNIVGKGVDAVVNIVDKTVA